MNVFEVAPQGLRKAYLSEPGNTCLGDVIQSVPAPLIKYTVSNTERLKPRAQEPGRLCPDPDSTEPLFPPVK